MVLLLVQKRPVAFCITAVVTSSDLEFDVSDIEFGHCTIYETLCKSVQLTNHSLLPQPFGFVHLPEVGRSVSVLATLTAL